MKTATIGKIYPSPLKPIKKEQINLLLSKQILWFKGNGNQCQILTWK